jgi:hypothetical protein
LEHFHTILGDISRGRATEAVRSFFVQAYLRGAEQDTAERVDVEGTTSIFPKRRYRDRWNRVVVRRIAKVHCHSLKVKARVRARGARGQQWYTDARTKLLRKKARPLSLWNLHLSGDWHKDHETKPQPPKPHLMRVMLTSNLAVDQRFANGTQGRLLTWSPAEVASGRVLSAGHPELSIRFAKESSLSLPSMAPEASGVGGRGCASLSSSACHTRPPSCRCISWTWGSGRRP